MVINAISKMIKKIWFIILVIIILFFLLFVMLRNGIEISKIFIPNASLSGLYIKLDKKLFVKIDDIKVSKGTSKKKINYIDDFDDILNKIPLLHKFFDTVLINNLAYEDENISLKYQYGHLFIYSDHLRLELRVVSYEKGAVEIVIPDITLKDFNVTLSGAINGNIKKDNYSFVGNFNAYEISGNMSLDFKNDMLNYKINSNEFSYSIFERFMDNLITHVELDVEAQEWIYKNIKASSYKLLNFSGKFNTKSMEFYPKEIDGSAEAYNVNVTFHEDVAPAIIEKVDIKFTNDELIIFPHNATYVGLKVNEGSNVTISNIIKDKTIVKVHLFSNELFDENINNILTAFEVGIPVKQYSGKNDVYVGIFVQPEPFDVDVIGRFEVINSNFTISNVSFFSPYSSIALKNSVIDFKDSRLIMQDMLDISTNASLNAQEGVMIANTTINNFTLSAKSETIVAMNNISSSVVMDIRDDGVKFTIDEYDVDLAFAPLSVLEFNSLEKISKFSPLLLEYGVDRGTLLVYTNDFENFNIFASIQDIPNLPLIHNDKNITTFDGEIKIFKDLVQVKNFDETINATFGEKIEVEIKDIDVVINSDKLSIASNNQTIANITTIPINFSSTNGRIIIEPNNLTIHSTDYQVDIDDGKITLKFKDKNGMLEAIKTDTSFEVNAANFTSKFINELTSREFFNGGTFSTHVEGNNTDDFSGKFIFYKTNLKEFKILNNILAFINTVPALATLNNPKYSSDGYPVRQGVVEFSRMENLIYIPNLYIEGYSADIEGLGYVDLDNKDIYLDLKISTLKSLSGIIDMIPLVNFIILGDDGKITLKISIRGKYDDPKVETNVAEGALKSPVNVIKRVFQLPFHIVQ